MADVIGEGFPGFNKAEQLAKPSETVNEKRQQARLKKQRTYSIASRFHEVWRETRRLPGTDSYEPLLVKTGNKKWIEEHQTDQIDIANTTYTKIPGDIRTHELEDSHLAPTALSEIENARNAGRPLDDNFFADAVRTLYIGDTTHETGMDHYMDNKHSSDVPDVLKIKYKKLMQVAVAAYETPIPPDIQELQEREDGPREAAEDKIEHCLQIVTRNSQFFKNLQKKEAVKAFLDSPSVAKINILRQMAEAIPKKYEVSTKPPLTTRLFGRSRQQVPERNLFMPKYEVTSEEQLSKVFRDVINFDFVSETIRSEAITISDEQAKTQTETFLQFVRDIDPTVPPHNPTYTTIKDALDSALFQSPKLKDELTYTYQTLGFSGLKARLFSATLRRSDLGKAGAGTSQKDLAKIIDYQTSAKTE